MAWNERRGPLLAGVTAAILLHGLALIWQGPSWRQGRPDTLRLQVMLQPKPAAVPASRPAEPARLASATLTTPTPHPRRPSKIPLSRQAGAPISTMPAVTGNPPAETPPTTDATPTIDLDAARKTASALVREEAARQPKTHPALARAEPEQESRLAKDFQKSVRADCKEAYSGFGLLAVVPLVLDTVRDKGCKW